MAVKNKCVFFLPSKTLQSSSTVSLSKSISDMTVINLLYISRVIFKMWCWSVTLFFYQGSHAAKKQATIQDGLFFIIANGR
jgi:hypothetical protein